MPLQFCSFYNGVAQNPCPAGERCNMCSSLGTDDNYEGCVCTFQCSHDFDCEQRYPNSPRPVKCSTSLNVCVAPVTPSDAAQDCREPLNPNTLTFGIDLGATQPTGDQMQFGFAPCSALQSEQCTCAHVCTPSTACSSLNGQLAYVDPTAVYNLATGQFNPIGNDPQRCPSDAVAQSSTPMCIRGCPVPEPPPPEFRKCTPVCAATPVPSALTFTLLDAESFPLQTELGIVCTCVRNSDCDDNDPRTIDHCALLEQIEPRCATGGAYEGDCLHGVCVHSCMLTSVHHVDTTALVAGSIASVLALCCCCCLIGVAVFVFYKHKRKKSRKKNEQLLRNRQEEAEQQRRGNPFAHPPGGAPPPYPPGGGALPPYPPGGGAPPPYPPRGGAQAPYDGANTFFTLNDDDDGDGDGGSGFGLGLPSSVFAHGTMARRRVPEF